MIREIWNNRNTIFKAIFNKLFKFKNRDRALERLETCMRCPHASMNKNKPQYKPGKYTNLPYKHCTLCGCSLYLKIYADWDNYPDRKYNPCPRKFWKR